MMSSDTEFGVYQAFQRAGLNPKDLYEPNITYRMVEKVVFDIKAFYPVSYYLVILLGFIWI